MGVHPLEVELIGKRDIDRKTPRLEHLYLAAHARHEAEHDVVAPEVERAIHERFEFAIARSPSHVRSDVAAHRNQQEVSAAEQLDAQPREAEGTALGRSGGDTEATDGRGRWRFTSACSGGFYRTVAVTSGWRSQCLSFCSPRTNDTDMEPKALDAATAALRGTHRFSGMVEAGWVKLDDRAREVLLRRHQGDTLASIADDFGLSRERVRGIQRNAERQLAEAVYDEARRPLIDAIKESHKEKPEAGHWTAIPIRDLRLPVRALNGLRVNGCSTVGDVVELGSAALRRTRNIGATSVRQIEETVESLGVDLHEEGFFDPR